MAMDSRLSSLLGGFLGGRRTRQPTAGQPDTRQETKGYGTPLSASGVASVNPDFVRPGGTRNTGQFPATPVASAPPPSATSQGIDQQRPESQTQAAQIQAWNAYRRAEKAAGRPDPGQYRGG
jgi:hypothetical protein